jgi:hypothetical protein
MCDATGGRNVLEESDRPTRRGGGSGSGSVPSRNAAPWSGDNNEASEDSQPRAVDVIGKSSKPSGIGVGGEVRLLIFVAASSSRFGR